MTNELRPHIRASYACQLLLLFKAYRCKAHLHNAALEGLDGDLPTSGSLAYVFCPKYASIEAVILEVNPPTHGVLLCRHSSHWVPFGRSVEKSVQERLSGVQQRYQLLVFPK